MTEKKIPSLVIGGLEINPPIIQGGMGVRISCSGLASAVANEGCVGTIASVGMGDYVNSKASDFIKVNNDSLRDEIRTARSKSKGIIAVNVMVVLSNFEELVKVCVEEKVDIIISGSGLPLDLPRLTQGTDIRLIPIVSSARALAIIYKKWKQNFNKVPDAVIVEGPMAGGHLGYAFNDVNTSSAPTLEQLITEMVVYLKTLPEQIPLVAAGGIFDGADIVKFLKLGANGVQMATRFVCTDECDAHIDFKKAYVAANKEDITIIKSPVGLPGRVIKGTFVDRVKNNETIPFKCPFHCLRTCDPKTAPYCIARVLHNASTGQLNDSFVFAGSNAHRRRQHAQERVRRQPRLRR